MKAVKELHVADDESKLSVMELIAAPVKTKKNSIGQAQQPDAGYPRKVNNRAYYQPLQQQQQPSGPQRRFSHAGFHVPHAHPQAELGARRRISLMHNMKFSSIDEEQQKKDQFALNPNAPTFQMHPMQRRLSRPSFVHPGALEMQMQFAQPSWMIRRFAPGPAPNGHFGGGGEFMASPGLPNVVRIPRGPDKGKGFQFQKWCRNRMESAPKKPALRSHAVPIVAPPSDEKEDEMKKEDKNVESEEAPVADEGAVALPVPPVAVVVEPAPVADSASSDSGNEDGGFSEQEFDNERSR
jgi:hypothetical protein